MFTMVRQRAKPFRAGYEANMSIDVLAYFVYQPFAEVALTLALWRSWDVRQLVHAGRGLHLCGKIQVFMIGGCLH